MTKGLVRIAAAALAAALTLPCCAAEESTRAGLQSEFVTFATEDLAVDSYTAEADDCYCSDCSVSHWIAGTEVTFLGIDARSGGRVTLTLDDSDTAGTDASFRDGDGIENFSYAPRIWIGRQFGERWGTVVRFWQLTDYETTLPERTPGTTQLTNFATFGATNHAQLQTFDIEGIRTFTPGRWKLDGSLGARYGSFDVDSAVTGFGVFTSGNFINLAFSNGTQFSGTGITGGLLARRQLGNSCAHVFLGARGSALWGLSDSFSRTVGTVAASPNAPLVGAATVTRNNAVASATIAELQVGLELDFQLHPWPVHAFFRTAFELQHWDIDTLPTGGTGFGGTISDLTVNGFSSINSPLRPDAQLYGVSIATGFTW